MFAQPVKKFSALKESKGDMVFLKAHNCILLRHLNPAPLITSCLSEIHFNIVLPSTLKHKWHVSLMSYVFLVSIMVCTAVDVTIKVEITPRFKKIRVY